MTFPKKPIGKGYAHELNQSMNPRNLQHKVTALARQLLYEANGDSVRALGLLVLALDEEETQSSDHAWSLIIEVRRALMPDSFEEFPKPIRHLVGEASWEGVQHCLRCGKALTVTSNGHERGETRLFGYVFEIGTRSTSEPCDDYQPCT